MLNNRYRYRVTQINKIVDGDTIDLTIDLGFCISFSERFRLYGINAPELRTDPGKKSKTRLGSFLGVDPAETWDSPIILDDDLTIEAQTILYKTKPKSRKGKYGRWLCILHCNGININEEMVKTGAAVDAIY